ncbi:hypothetical protein [Ekhidna sp.]|uniref:hypothetical protein n=1 Tax=Ekhidna sp. TaxID=2608089 RepID=UPI003CCBF8C5
MYKYIFYTLLAVVFTFLIHEFSHWIMGEFLGYEMRMTLNKVYPNYGKYNKDWHYTIISFVGPLITLVQAIIYYLVISRNNNKNFFPFLFTCFYLELLSGIMNYRNPNDLGRIGTSLNMGLFTLPTVFTSLHFLMLLSIAKKKKYKLKFVVKTLLLVILFSSIWILTNQFYHVVIIA